MVRYEEDGDSGELDRFQPLQVGVGTLGVGQQPVPGECGVDRVRQRDWKELRLAPW